MAADSDKLAVGRLGEKLAAEFLKKRGAKVIGHNFYTRFGELDLIAQLGDELLFCEVKTRTSVEYGFPELAVNQSKLEHLIKAAEIYLAEKQWTGFWRLDTIAVQLDPAKRLAKIRWFKNVSQKI